MTEMPRLSKIEYEILNLLRAGEMYGLEMVKASNILKRGTVYVSLDRMADKGFVVSRADKNPNLSGLPRRLYSISAHGRRVLYALEAADAAYHSHWAV
jgi:PadR family transcriptional regulator, regulatory protein PadR